MYTGAGIDACETIAATGSADYIGTQLRGSHRLSDCNFIVRQLSKDSY